MKTQKHTSWDDLLFENRNKDYGAYDLRKNENFNLLKSLLVGILFVGIAAGALSFTNKNDIEEPVMPERKVIVNVTPFDENKKEEKPKVVAPAKKVVATTTKKINKSVIPDPKDSPQTETPVNDNRDLGKLIMPGSNDNDVESIQTGIGSTESDSSSNDFGDDTTAPEEEKTTYNAREVSMMAVFPGCEKFSSNKEKSRECFAKKLQDELSIQLNDFGEVAEAKNIRQAVAKLQFVVDKSGEIIQIKSMNGGNAELSKESKEALERIAKRFIQKGKLIQPAKLDDGTPVNLIFTIPVKFIQY